jgi:ATP-dependent exoDNAse (exonuclease V) alpha subunit
VSGHFHLSVKIGSRAKGKSAVAASAYRAGARLRCDADGTVRDYSRKAGVVAASVMTPDGAPEWARDREELWNRVEAAERRGDARLYREFEVSIPREIPEDERLAVVQAWAAERLVSRGMVVDVALHDVPARDGGRNVHAHVLATDRPLDPTTATGFAARKDRGWNAPELVEEARSSWAEHANRALQRAGSASRVDHRSLEAQRGDALARGDQAAADELMRAPEPKIGVAAKQIAKRKPGTSWRRRAWDQVRQANRAMQQVFAQLRREEAEARRRRQRAAGGDAR